jgi:DNA sulfur modification protein DndC
MNPLPISTEELLSFDHYICYCSGGACSTAALLNTLELGVPREKLEIWHHDVDGREEGKGFFDWPFTPAYVRALGKHLGIPVYFSWREGGLHRELNRRNQRTAPVHFETPDGEKVAGGINGPLNTRLRWPALSSNLSVRWCSSSCKIDVASIGIANQPRFKGKRILTISGERAEESPGRALYKVYEPDRTNAPGPRAQRTVYRLRPVHSWAQAECWEIIKRHGILPAPSYRARFGRLSCAFCVFSMPDQWATTRQLFPEKFARIAQMERDMHHTIDPKLTVEQKANLGTPYPEASDRTLIAELKDEHWDKHYSIFTSDWKLPAGAFRKCGGPL